MSILFSNPPWWEGKESRGFFRKKRWRRGVRAGSRWPFTYLGRCTPDNPRAKDYMPYPYFLGYSTIPMGWLVGLISSINSSPFLITQSGFIAPAHFN